MSRALSLIAPTTGYASPNQLVTAQLATNVGFNPNDYVYAYGNNQVGNLGSTIGVGLVSTYIAGTRVNGAVQTGFTPTSVMSGPYSASATYTGTTRTQGNLLTTTTNFSNNTTGSLQQSCVLNNGNIAAVFRDATASDLKISVYTSAGVSVKVATTISTQTSAGAGALAISSMLDGGFVVVYTSNVSTYFQRFDSSGTVYTAETVVSGTMASQQGNLSVAGGTNGGFAINGNNSNAQSYMASYSSSSTYLGQVTITSATNTYQNAIAGLTNGNYALAFHQNANTLYYAIVSSSPAIVVSWTSITNCVNESVGMAAYDGGFVITNRNPSNSQFRLVSVTNSGSVLNSGLTNNFTSGYSSVCIAEDNTAYVFVQNTSSGAYTICKYTSINSSAMVLNSTFTINSFTPTQYTFNNLSNALNGSLYYSFGASGKASFVTINQATYTQNTTTLTNTGFYTPTNGYYLLGIGATTAAAGSSGLIYTNGGIALPSTYPSVSTGYAFDYQSNSYWAQRGTINGRTINLQGAQ